MSVAVGGVRMGREKTTVIVNNYRVHALLIDDWRGKQLRPWAHRFSPLHFAKDPEAPWRTEGVESRSLLC